MKRRLSIVLLLVIFCNVNEVSKAQNHKLTGRSALGLNMGMYSGSKTSNIVAIYGYNTEVDAGGFAGGLFFKYWMQENMALKFSAGVLTGNAKVTVNNFVSTQQASTVIPVMVGVNYYFIDLFADDAVRPFVSGEAGMFVGTEAKNSTLSQQVHTENAFGGRVGAGIDLILGNHFIIGANIGYNVMSNFSSAVGGNKNYNGADFLFNVQYIF
jgi:outer membrane protein W